MKSGDLVLVDTNVIIEGHILDCWSTLIGAYKIETVDLCIAEAMAGDYDWNGRRPSEFNLRSNFANIYNVSDEELAYVKLNGGNGLDTGEQALWAHALSRQDTWILCGPDRTSMRFGHEQKKKERLVSLELLLRTAGYNPKITLRHHFTEKWLNDLKANLTLGIL